MMWFIDKKYSSEVVNTFSSLEKVFSLIGEEKMSGHSLSEVIKITINGEVYYVKRYLYGGKHLRKHITCSRCKTEWKNLNYFRSLAIKTPNVVAYGDEKRYGLLNGRAVLITEEAKNTRDLLYLSKNQSEMFHNKIWKQRVFKQIADYLAKLHNNRFIHNDLHWRNILVTLDKDPVVYFFDVPMGSKYYFRFKRFATKDLANLDKLGKKFFSKTDRLRFYLYYRNIKQLTAADKVIIAKVISFFQDKENARA